MATSTGELLDELTELATTLATKLAETGGLDRHDVDDARAALGQLGATLIRLSVDGVARADDERARWVRELGAACGDLARQTQADPGVRPGRLTQVAAAAAETVGLARDELTRGGRWATAVAVTDTVHRLIGPATVTGDAASQAGSACLIVAEAAATVLSRLAALDPPTAEQCAVLERPVPDPFPVATSTVAEQIREAMAGLLYTTRPGTGPHAVADILAVTFVAETVCRAGASVVGADGDAARLAEAAAGSCRDVRTAMSPFNDGSRQRRPLTDTPPSVSHALTLHETLQKTVPQAVLPARAPLADGTRTAILDVIGRLPALTQHAAAAVLATTGTGQVLAYACDLLPRNNGVRHFRVAEVLAGHRRAGLIAADVTDVAEVLSTLRRTENLTAALSDRLTAAEPTGVRAANDGIVPTRIGLAGEPDRDDRAARSAAERSAYERAQAVAHAGARPVQSGPPAATPRR